MAASSALKISKAMSKVSSPSIGSPKKTIRPTSSKRAPTVTVSVFKKPTEVPKLSKVAKEATTEGPAKAVKVVNTLLSVDPTRRAPSLPISPWNADHPNVIRRNTTKTGTTTGETKKKVPVPPHNQTPRPKSAIPKKIIPSNIARKLKANDIKENICKNGQKLLSPKKTSSSVSNTTPVSYNIRKQMKTPTPVKKPPKSIAVAKPVTPPPGTSKQSTLPLDDTESTLKLDGTASTLSAALAVLKDEAIVLSDKLHSIGFLNQSPKSPTEKIDVQIGEKIPCADTLSENKIKNLNKGPEINDEGVSPGMTNNLSPFTASSMDDSSMRVRTRRSLDSISSLRTSLPSNDKPWSPFGQSLPRVFERQYDNFADALFAPYITDDESATTMRSPRFSF